MSDSDDCEVLPDPNPNPHEFSLIAKKEQLDSAAEPTPEKVLPRPRKDSDTETVVTLDLCHNQKKKNSVSLSTYIIRPNKEEKSLKSHLDKLNSKSTETVTAMLSRESKRRKIEVNAYSA